MPDTFQAAAVLLRLLYEREYGTHTRAEQREVEIKEARLARKYASQSKRLPREPGFVEPTES